MVANPSLLAGSGVSGIIHKAAGAELEKAAKLLGPLKPGSTVMHVREIHESLRFIQTKLSNR